MRLPHIYNYIAAFLTMKCCYQCAYCINGDRTRQWKGHAQLATGGEWIKAFEKIETDLPVTLCGGEPSLHKDFFKIINGLPQKVDLLTNLAFDVDRFIKEVSPSRFDSTKGFAPIRASFHSAFMDHIETQEKIKKLSMAGFRVGLYCVDAPSNSLAIQFFREIPHLDFQIKPLLDNEYPHKNNKSVECRIRELLVAPNLEVYRCHRDLYREEYQQGKLVNLDEVNPAALNYEFQLCMNGDECHSCDLKLKRDRFGAPGYRAVEIRDLEILQDI